MSTDLGIITAVLISFLSVFSGIGGGFFCHVVFGTTRNRRALAFLSGIGWGLMAFIICMWLVKNGTLA